MPRLRLSTSLRLEQLLEIHLFFPKSKFRFFIHEFQLPELLKLGPSRSLIECAWRLKGTKLLLSGVPFLRLLTRRKPKPTRRTGKVLRLYFPFIF
jgi:hypothetical protein